MADRLDSSFTGTGVSDNFRLSKAKFNVSVKGISGSTRVELQRSFDEGVTWFVVETFSSDFEGVGCEVEKIVLYRFECTSHTGGPVRYRLSRAALGN